MRKEFESDKEILERLNRDNHLVVMDMGQPRQQDGWWPIVSLKKDGDELKIYGGDNKWHVIDSYVACMFRKAFLAKRSLDSKSQ